MLVPEDLSAGPMQNVGITDGNGYFVVKKVRAGVYYAVVNAPGVVSPLAFLDFSMLQSPGDREAEREAFAEAFKHFEKIIVNGITDLDVQIAARRGAAIGGRVIYDDGDAAVGVKVEILRKADNKLLGVIPNFSAFSPMFFGNDFGSLQTDDRGVYRLSGLPPGEYVVRVTENTTHTETSRTSDFEGGLFGNNSFLTLFYPDVFEQENAEVITVDYGQEVTDVNLVIPERRLFKIGGKIVSRKDKTPVKARIVIQRTEAEKIYTVASTTRFGQRISVDSDEEGNWLFKEIPKGKYKLIVEPLNIPPQTENDYNYPSNANVEVTRKVIPGLPKLAKKVQEIGIEDQDLTDLMFELNTGATLSGTIAVENFPNQMPQYIKISLVNADHGLTEITGISNYPYEETPSPSKLNREFKLERISEGKATLQVTVSEDDYYVKSAMLGNQDLLTSELEIKAGENLQNIKIVLSKAVGKLKVKVIGEDRLPSKKAEVWLVPTDARRRNPMFRLLRKTDEKGEFEVKLAPGEYAFFFSSPDMPDPKDEKFPKWLDEAISKAEKVKIEAGKTEVLNITRKN